LLSYGVTTEGRPILLVSFTIGEEWAILTLPERHQPSNPKLVVLEDGLSEQENATQWIAEMIQQKDPAVAEEIRRAQCSYRTENDLDTSKLCGTFSLISSGIFDGWTISGACNPPGKPKNPLFPDYK